MSLLLDALNKADQERKRNEATPGINSNHEQVSHANSHKKSIVITAVLVAGFMMLLAAIYWLGQRSATPAATATTNTTTATAQNSSPAKSQIESGKAASVVIQGNSTQGAATQTTAPSQDIDTSEENVASLYQQNTPTQNTTVPPNTPVADAPVESAINPATNNSTTSTTELTPGTPTSIAQFANLPDLHDLPTQVLGKIPSLNYSEHNYNNNGGSVKINGIIRHVNDQLPAGIVIDKILEDGMILHIDNYSFKMRALNSWINM